MTGRSICGVFPTGRPSSDTLPHGIALIDRRPGSTLRGSAGNGAGAGRFITGACVVTGGRVVRTAARVADRGGGGGGTGSGAAATNVSRLALGGDAGMEEMPSHAAPPPSATTRPAAATATRRPRCFAAGSWSASTITTGEPGPFLRGFAPNHVVR